MRKLTVSIVTHRSPAGRLRTALECVARCGEVYRVYVIDNSPDDSLRQAVEGLKRVTYRHVANDGFGAGHNVAIREALADGADFHLVMNDDVRWEGDVLTPLMDRMEKDSKIGMIMPKVFYPDGALQYTARMLPTPLDVFAKRFLPEALVKRRVDRYLLADADHDREFESPYLLGSFLLFRGEALREANGFDERFFMYPEDIDITRRVHERWRTLYWPGVNIIHDHAAASRKSWRMLKIHVVNMIRYFNKWGWFYDRKRRRANKELLANMPRLKGPRPNARG